MNQLPREQAAYVAIATDAVSEYLLNAHDPGYLAFQQTVDTLGALLYFDGRSELGLLTLVELAFQNPAAADEASNALAYLASHYRSCSGTQPSNAVLIERFERYMNNPALFHNARECRNALRLLDCRTSEPD